MKRASMPSGFDERSFRGSKWLELGNASKTQFVFEITLAGKEQLK